MISVAAYIGAEPIIGIFRKGDSQVIEIGTLALRLQILTFCLGAWNVTCNMMLQSIGKATSASIVAAARQGLFFIPLIIILPRMFGLLGIQLCQPISDVFAFLLTVPMGLYALREMKEQEIKE